MSFASTKSARVALDKTFLTRSQADATTELKFKLKLQQSRLKHTKTLRNIQVNMSRIFRVIIDTTTSFLHIYTTKCTAKLNNSVRRNTTPKMRTGYRNIYHAGGASEKRFYICKPAQYQKILWILTLSTSTPQYYLVIYNLLDS